MKKIKKLTSIEEFFENNIHWNWDAYHNVGSWLYKNISKYIAYPLEIILFFILIAWSFVSFLVPIVVFFAFKVLVKLIRAG